MGIFSAEAIIYKLLAAVANEKDIIKLVRANDNNEDTLIRKQIMKVTSIGFVTGLPGGLSMAPSAFADLTSLLYNQARMIAGIAYIRGYDISSRDVQYVMIMCLLGEKSMKEVSGITTEVTIRALAAKYTTRETKQALVRKITEKFAIVFGKQTVKGNLRHFIPIGSGIVCGGLDAINTRNVALLAKKIFPIRHRYNHIHKNANYLADNKLLE